MTQDEWLQKARDSKEILLGITYNYHPIQRPVTQALMDEELALNITAPDAEFACEQVRRQIKAQDDDPLQKLSAAIDSGHVDVIMNVLNQVWFGIPESTSCWGIKGFHEMVSLLEDPPDDEEEI
jgi:hypothetical protein